MALTQKKGIRAIGLSKMRDQTVEIERGEEKGEEEEEGGVKQKGMELCIVLYGTMTINMNICFGLYGTTLDKDFFN